MKSNPSSINGDFSTKCKDQCSTNKIRNTPSKEYLEKGKYLSEFKSFTEKELAKKNLGIPTSEEYVDKIYYSNDAYPGMKTLRDALDRMLYKPIEINLTSNPSIAEEGQVINAIQYNWKVNKINIKSQTFDKIELEPDIRQYTAYGPFTENVLKTLTISDGTESKSITTELKFYKGIHYGTSSNLTEYSTILTGNTSTQFTIDGTNDSNIHIIICVPYDFGPASFYVNGFKGGFELMSNNFQYDKYNTGTLTRYRIYMSDNGGLGQTTVKVTWQQN